MSKYANLDGRAITKLAREEILRSGAEMRLNAEYDHLPAEHRARLRAERTAAVRADRAAAGAALDEWAAAAVADAQERLRSDPLGTAAEESRRVSDELKLGHVVATAKAEDARRGLRIPDGTTRPVANAEAYSLAERARTAYLDGDLDGAALMARASVELGGPALASQVMEVVQHDRDLADPKKARALGDLEDIEMVMAAFDRDASAAVARALQDSIELARALGESAAVQELGKEAAEASVRAKLAAAAGAKRFGGIYVEPPGVLPGLPANRDPRGFPQPEGAHLPEPRP